MSRKCSAQANGNVFCLRKKNYEINKVFLDCYVNEHWPNFTDCRKQVCSQRLEKIEKAWAAGTF